MQAPMTTHKDPNAAASGDLMTLGQYHVWIMHNHFEARKPWALAF
jgi:hypothetical protein